MRRVILFDHACATYADRLGGYQRIDPSWEAIEDGLMRNPFGFPVIENDFTKARYAVTRPIGDLPALVWVFEIDQNGNIVMYRVEEWDPY